MHIKILVFSSCCLHINCLVGLVPAKGICELYHYYLSIRYLQIAAHKTEEAQERDRDIIPHISHSL